MKYRRNVLIQPAQSHDTAAGGSPAKLVLTILGVLLLNSLSGKTPRGPASVMINYVQSENQMHAAISIEIPPTLTDAVTENLGETDLARWVLEALVTTAVGEGLISTGQAAELLGLGYFQMLALLKERHVPSAMTEEELMGEQADLKVLFPDLFQL